MGHHPVAIFMWAAYRCSDSIPILSVAVYTYCRSILFYVVSYGLIPPLADLTRGATSVDYG